MSQLWTYSLMGSTVRRSSIRVSTETKSSTMVSIICNFLIPYPTATSLARTKINYIRIKKKRNSHDKQKTKVCNANIMVKEGRIPFKSKVSELHSKHLQIQ